VHDLSKFYPSEWGPYRDNFFGEKPVPSEVKESFIVAWGYHQMRNPHHWEHWVMRQSDGTYTPLKMPRRYVLEMVADWVGAGRAITGTTDIVFWYAENRDGIVLHPDTRREVDCLVPMFAEPKKWPCGPFHIED
jgi:hypothetical protein